MLRTPARGDEPPLAWQTHAELNGAYIVPMTLIYDQHDPFAFTISVRERRWVFARELLAGGLIEPTGDGDVHISPQIGDPTTVLLFLSAPSGEAVLRIPRDPLERAVDEAEALVPLGAEAIDWDWEMWLLGGAA